MSMHRDRPKIEHVPVHGQPGLSLWIELRSDKNERKKLSSKFIVIGLEIVESLTPCTGTCLRSFLSVIQILTITHLTIEFDKEWKITQYVQDLVLIT
jgi:hypothetical protein